MVISSIDLKGGHVVQLKNGRDLVLKRDDAESLIKEFDKYGEVAVIDLDAALGNFNEDGTTANTEILKSLLRRGNVRVGGGIKSAKQARELVSLGAEKVIIGSMAWKGPGKAPDAPSSGADSFLNTEALDELTRAIGRQRIIISVDAIGGNIAVKGWTEATKIPLIEGARAAERYASELLYTCVEREGLMAGGDTESILRLRGAVSCRVVAAGGINSLDEVVTLERAGCDVQLGMALYTGRVGLAESFIGCLDWKKTAGLVPIIAQSTAGEVLMLGYASREALAKTFETGRLTFFSRTKGALWTKGETSGNFLNLVRVRADCDRDTVLATVEPVGPTCHKGGYTCFTGRADAKSNLERLYTIIRDRIENPTEKSYTATLNDTRVREKVMEEAEELTEAEGRDEVIWEAADLAYFMSVLMCREGVTWQDVYDELDRRHKK